MEVILGTASQTMEIPTFWLVFLFIPPLLTMRLFAEERSTGTMETLMTAPIRDWQIVFAKFVACFAFYLLMWLPTLAYLPTLMDLKATWDLTAWTPKDVLAIDRGTAGGGRLVSGEDTHGRRFPGTIGPEEANDLPAIDVERDIADGGIVAIIFGEVLDVNHGSANRGVCRRKQKTVCMS